MRKLEASRPRLDACGSDLALAVPPSATLAHVTFLDVTKSLL